MAVAGENFKRFAFAPESSFKTAGAWVNPSGLKIATAPAADREQLPREDALNSRGDRYAALPGKQLFTAEVQLYLHGASYAQIGALIEAAAGTENAGGALGAVSAGDETSATVATGTAAAILKATGSDSLVYYVATLTQVGTTVTLATALPSGVNITDLENLSELSGGVFDYTLGAAADTFSLEFDQSTRPTSTTQEVILAKGAAVTSLMMMWEQGQAMSLSLTFDGAEYTKSGGAAANLSDPAVWSSQYPGWAADTFLTKAASPAWDDAKTNIKNMSAQLAPPIIKETGSLGLDGGSDGSSVLPGSDTYGYTRDPIGTEQVTMRVPYLVAYETDYEAGTAYRFFGVWYPGVPGGTPGAARFILSIPRLVQSARPKLVPDGGGLYCDLTFQIERTLTANSPEERYHIGMVPA